MRLLAFQTSPCLQTFRPGRTVLDLGCGAGLDTLIAAQRVGTAGKVIGVDFREASAIRFSLGRTTTREEIEQVVSLL